MAARCIQMFLALLLTTPLSSLAGPLVLEESVRISKPDPSCDWPIAVATDGEWLLATGALYELDTGLTNNARWLYRRQFDGSWSLVRQLHQFSFQEDYDEPPIQLAVRNGVAVIVKENASWIFEHQSGAWLPVASPIQTNGMDLALNGGAIMYRTTTQYDDIVAVEP